MYDAYFAHLALTRTPIANTDLQTLHDAAVYARLGANKNDPRWINYAVNTILPRLLEPSFN